MKKVLSITVVLMLVAALLGGCGGSEQKELTRGVWEDDTYVSEYANLKVSLPEGWTAATDEELAEIMGVAADILTEQGTEITQELLEKTTIYDMMAQNLSTGANILVMYENMNLTAGGSKMDLEEYVEALKTQMAEVDIYKSVEYGDLREEKIGEDTYQVMEANVLDYEFSQYYYLRKIDKYMLVVCISQQSSEDVSEVVKMIGNYQ